MDLRDPLCAFSHLLTAAWALFVTPFMVRLARPVPGRKLAAAAFGLSMVLLFLASGLFHGLPYTAADNPVEFRFFQRLDQSAILILIAGTNTLPLVVLVGGRWGQRLLVGIWGLALFGIACLWGLPRPPYAVVVGVCLGMGWLGLLPIVRYYRSVGWRAMNWVWTGALLYSAGAICELTDWPWIVVGPIRFGPHEVFHLFCSAASVAFFVFIFRHVIRHHPLPGPNDRKWNLPDRLPLRPSTSAG